MQPPSPSRLALLAVSALVFSGAAAAQTKMAVVNMQAAVLETDEIKKASADLEAKYKPRQSELEKLRKQLEDIQQKLQAGQGKLSPQAEADLNAQGARIQRDLQRKGQDLQEEVDYERNEILTRSGRRMQDVVRKVAEAKGLDMVVDSGSTLYIKPALDLTKEVVAEYNKTHPSAAPAAAPK